MMDMDEISPLGGRGGKGGNSASQGRPVRGAQTNQQSQPPRQQQQKNSTALATAKVIVSSGEHPKKNEIKQVKYHASLLV